MIIDCSTTLQSFLTERSMQGMNDESVDMLEKIIRSCWEKGVTVQLDPGLIEACGTYNSTANTITFGQPALDDNEVLIDTAQHEFVHVLQDQADGLHNSELSTLGIPSTQRAENLVENAYSSSDHDVKELEIEAHSAEDFLSNPESDTYLRQLSVEEHLAIAYTAQGMDPIDAALQASSDGFELELFLI
jgi:hypothetical protein